MNDPLSEISTGQDGDLVSGELQTLVERNKRLETELLGFKRQYEEAMNYLRQFEEVQAANARLRQENGRLVTEKDEISRRLEITLLMNEELASKAGKEKVEDAFTPELNSLRQQLQNEKSLHAKQVQEMNHNLEESTALLKEQKKENKNLQNSLNSILEAAQSRFGIAFANASVLQNYLLKPLSEAPNESMSVHSERTIQEVESELSGQIRHFKKLARSESKSRKRLEDLHAQAERQLKIQSRESEKVIVDLEARINSIENDIKGKEAFYNKQLHEKDSIIQNLQNSLERTKDELQNQKMINATQRAPIVASPKPKNNSELLELREKCEKQAVKLQEAMAAVSALRKKSAVLASQVKSSEAMCETSIKRAESAERKCDDLMRENAEIQKRLDEVITNRDELVMQKAFSESQVKAEKASSSKALATINTMTTELTQVKAGLARAESLIDSQRKEISKYSKERNSVSLLIQKHANILQNYEQMIAKLQKERDDLRKKLNAELAKPLLPSPPREEKREDVPIHVWSENDVPRELSEPIMRVVVNDIPVAHKIAQVLSIINRHYKDIISRYDKEKSKLQSQNAKKLSFVNKFLGNFGKALDEEDLSVQKLDSDPLLGNDLIDRIRKIKQSNAEITQKTLIHEDNIIQLCSKLNVDTVPQALDQIDNLVEVITTTEARLKRERAKQRKLAKIQASLDCEFREREAELEDAFAEREKRLTQLETEKTVLETSLRQSQQEADDLKSQISDLKESHARMKDSSAREFHDTMQKLAADSQQERDQLLARIQSQDDALDKTTDELQKSQREVAQWRKTAKLLKSSKEANEQQVKRLLAQIADAEREHNERITSERKAQQTKYVQIISEIKSKSESLSKFLDKTTEALAESDAKVKELTALNSQLAFEKNQALVRYDAQRDEVKREKQLAETRIQASELAFKMQCQAALEEHKAKLELEKHETYASIVHLFKRYFDPRNQLDDTYVHSVIQKAAADLDKLSQQDAALRKLLGAGVNDPIEDTLARVLLNQRINVV